MLLLLLPVLAVLALIANDVAQYTGLIRPPRPMYCNVYGHHQRGQTFPSWGPSYYMYDKANRVGWADFVDNSILIVDPADGNEATPWSIRPGMKTCASQKLRPRCHIRTYVV